jgi:hypothetical protein
VVPLSLRPSSSRVFAGVACAWGLLGLFASLIEAIVRLIPHALEPIEQGLSTGAALGYVGFVVFNAYAEGYRGFQRGFSPRVAARARLLFDEPRVMRALLAPLFVMALVEARRRRLIINWLLVLVITALVLLLRRTPQPYRGIVDGGVVVGLVWGTLTTAYCCLEVLRGRLPPVDPELPDQRTP